MSKRLYRFDQEWRNKGFPIVAGVDEAGRGPWAGPVVAAAAVLKPDTSWKGLDDSKKISPENRERLYDVICRESLFYSVSIVAGAIVDEINILQATFTAMARSLHGLGIRPDIVLVDGNRRMPDWRSSQEAIVKGDGKSASIAAASILAKVTRDRWMREAHEKFPQYDFINNKGYGTPSHIEALRRHGPCEIHRRSFLPVAQSLSPFLPFPEFETQPLQA